MQFLIDVYSSALYLLQFQDVEVADDVAHVDDLRQTVMKQLEATQNDYSLLEKKNMHCALSLIRTGLSSVRQMKLIEADNNFIEALTYATNSFNESTAFTELSLSFRLRVFCTIMIQHGCYLPSEGDVCNRTQLREDCQALFKQFTTHSLVSSALRDEFEGRSAFDVLVGRLKLSESSRASRQHILHHINTCNIFFENKFDIRFPVYKTLAESVNLGETKDLLITRSTTQICCFTISQGRLFAGCGDNSIVIYDLTTFDKISVLRGHSFFVEVLLVHNHVLYSASYDRNIILWDLNTLQGISMMTKCSKMISSLAVHSSSSNNSSNRNSSSSASGNSSGGGSSSDACPRRRTLFTGSVGDDVYLRVWNLNTLTEMKHCYSGTFFWVFAVLVHQDRLYVSSTWYRGSDEVLHFHCITVWDLSVDITTSGGGMPLVGILKGHFHNIRSLSVHGRGTLCTGSCDKTVILWDISSLELQQILKGHSGEVNSLTHFNNRLYVSDAGKTVRVWHLLSLSGSEERSSSTSNGSSSAFHEPIRHLLAHEGRLFILSGGSVHIRLL